MCRTHWNQYTAGLARDAKARRAAEAPPAEDANRSAAQPAPKARRSDKL
jgi:hypothetical protein